MIGVNRGHSFKLGSESPFVEQPVPNEDVATLLDDEGMQWIAERRVVPIEQAEKEFGLEPGTLRKLGASP